LLLVGLLRGVNSPRAIARWGHAVPWPWRQRLGFTRPGGPDAATLQRVVRRVDVARLEAGLSRWLQQVRAAVRQGAARWLAGIAIDGKTLRGARRLGAKDAHLLSACCQHWGVVLGEVAVPDSTNEVGAVGPLLATLLLAGETVTLDAEFTQYLVADQIGRQGGAYRMVVKGNPPTLRRDCAHATAWPARYLGEARTVRLAHGRLAERTLVAADARDLAWPPARPVLRLHRRFVHQSTGRVVSDETV
jgi:hypothetical protein